MNSTTITSASPAPTVIQGDSPACIGRARQAAGAFAHRLTPALSPHAADALVLVVCELVTNAVRHGGGHYTLRLSAGPETVTAAVSDPNPDHPRERTPDLEGGSGGFGWHLVRRLADRLTVTPGPGCGKTIRAELPL